MATNDAPTPDHSSDPTSPPDLVGTILAGRYRILELLGKGGMGMVYLGEHVTIGRRTAIKVLHSGSSDADAIARFTRGSRNAARIDHENVCRIFDFGDPPGGLHFLAMEYIEGESLYDLLQREARLPLKRTADIISQTANGLQAAHDLGIVHRDLKPANIMLTQAPDGSERVKVVDFDIAKGPPESDDAELTRPAWVIGTPEYMSPEQFMAHPLDGRSDIYSLGLILFRMVTGAPAFRATTPPEMMVERVSAPPQLLADVAPGLDLPESLQGVISKALAQGREDRWASAATFGAAVVAAIEGEAVEGFAPPAPSPSAAATMILDNPTPPTPVLERGGVPATEVAAAAGAQGPGQGMARGAPTAPAAATQAADPLPSPPGSRPFRPRWLWAGAAAVVLALGGWGTYQLTTGGSGMGLEPLDPNTRNTLAEGDAGEGGQPTTSENPTETGPGNAESTGDQETGGGAVTTPVDDDSTSSGSNERTDTDTGERAPPRPDVETEPIWTAETARARLAEIDDEIGEAIQSAAGTVSDADATRYAQESEAIFNAIADQDIRGEAAAIRGRAAGFLRNWDEAVRWTERAMDLGVAGPVVEFRLRTYRTNAGG